MDEQTVAQITQSTERLVAAAEALQQTLMAISAQQQEISAKIDKIVAAIEEGSVVVEANNPALAKEARTRHPNDPTLSAENAERMGHPGSSIRKTLSPLVTMILAKNGVDDVGDAGLLDKALVTLTPEQRIAVKSEMARAGLIQ